MSLPAASFAEKRRILQLETLYDLALSLHDQGSEGPLVQELLERVCAVLDPAAAAAVTCESYAGSRALSLVGWSERPPSGERLLEDPLWSDLLNEGGLIVRHRGEFGGRPYRELIAAPFAYRGVFLGYIAMIDKEARAGAAASFSDGDRRFLDSVAALAGVSLDNVRQVERLETQRERLEEENKLLKNQWGDEVGGQRFVAQAAPMRRVLQVVERVAPRGVSVLVRGESGTGKELIAKLLHLHSGRGGSLIALNCAALPKSLLESELFGIEGGVATGVAARPGKFELAHQGTLFLDEIGDMQPAIQAKLLRVLQEREVVRLGAQRPISVDVRLVAATHRDVEELISAGRFREDLYYRLKGVDVALPPLRERREDIPHLVRYFLAEFCRREGIAVPHLAPQALARMMSYGYPGNVRELRNVVEGSVSLAEGAIGEELVRSVMGTAADSAVAQEVAVEEELIDMETLERRHISKVLKMTGGNKSAAARILGLDRRTLLRKGF